MRIPWFQVPYAPCQRCLAAAMFPPLPLDEFPVLAQPGSQQCRMTKDLRLVIRLLTSFEAMQGAILGLID